LDHGRRILVVDDDESIRKTGQSYLKVMDSVDRAGKREEAISRSNEKTYDLVPVDIRLLDLNGSQLRQK
jgi:DNA-binding response OmpR family regulator